MAWRSLAPALGTRARCSSTPRICVSCATRGAARAIASAGVNGMSPAARHFNVRGPMNVHRTVSARCEVMHLEAMHFQAMHLEAMRPEHPEGMHPEGMHPAWSWAARDVSSAGPYVHPILGFARQTTRASVRGSKGSATCGRKVIGTDDVMGGGLAEQPWHGGDASSPCDPTCPSPCRIHRGPRSPVPTIQQTHPSPSAGAAKRAPHAARARDEGLSR